MPKVCIIGGNYNYHVMFKEQGWEIVENYEDADLVQFTGGEDVSPRLYGEECHGSTFYNTYRDSKEITIFEYCVRARKPMAGICRGGQFLHVMNGGDLWQDVDSHAIFGTHKAFTPDGLVELQVTSTHHQMMRMSSEEGEVLLVADECRAPKEHMVGKLVGKVTDEPDIESVYYKGTNSLCFQPHPEFSYGMQCREFYFRKIYELIGLTGDK